MQPTEPKTVRILSIITLILSILALIGSIFGTIALIGSIGMLSDPDVAYMINDALYEDPDFAAALASSGMTIDDFMGIFSAIIGVCAALVVVVAVFCILCIVASVKGIKINDNLDKAGKVMGWSIAAAVLSFLSGRLISMVLYIVAAVFANKIKNYSIGSMNYAQQAAFGQYAQAATQPQYQYNYQPQGTDQNAHAYQSQTQPAYNYQPQSAYSYQQQTQASYEYQQPASPQADAQLAEETPFNTADTPR